MNTELIKEIAIKVGDDWEHTLKEDREFLEKFAESIVKECAQFVEDKFDFCGDEIIIAEEVRKHFGVEE
jgi:ornithine cyclodeaminase/alanine dehydrogenase-like protein (mu-crystallin family)